MPRKGSPEGERGGGDGGGERTGVVEVLDKIANASFSAIRSVGDALHVPRRGKHARALTRQPTDPINLAAFRARRNSQRLIDVQARPRPARAHREAHTCRIAALQLLSSPRPRPAEASGLRPAPSTTGVPSDNAVLSAAAAAGHSQSHRRMSPQCLLALTSVLASQARRRGGPACAPSGAADLGCCPWARASWRPAAGCPCRPVPCFSQPAEGGGQGAGGALSASRRVRRPCWARRGWCAGSAHPNAPTRGRRACLDSDGDLAFRPSAVVERVRARCQPQHSGRTALCSR